MWLTRIFVPQNDKVRRWSIAGSTIIEILSLLFILQEFNTDWKV